MRLKTLSCDIQKRLKFKASIAHSTASVWLSGQVDFAILFRSCGSR
ncbi:hypothetical protein SL1157_2896 [Ruegeria lacuscaerulensis ITI-1157]|nr:hypothetical protein SL1157_2896 [Ruegeria lacuscaerulensis ITI-1157]